MAPRMKILAIIVGVVCCASVAAAQESQPNYCAEDQAKFCSNVQGLAVLKCLADHYDDLSPACQKQTKVVRDRIRGNEGQAVPPPPAPKKKQVREACAAEIDKYCKEMIGKPNKMKACMKEHEGDLSDGCKAALKALEESNTSAK